MFYIHVDSEKTTIAETDLGTITKTVYNPGESNETIVLITGIHPRETLSIKPEEKALSHFARSHDIQCINYAVDVTKNPTDYNEGRSNGEHLIADYVLPDIQSDNVASLVIISHSHNPDYGSGYYVATPAMDEASVQIAEKIKEYGNDFGYYPANTTSSYQSTSAKLVSKPLAESGYPTLVYEIPEDITERDATSRTEDLFDISLKILDNQV